MSQLLQRLAVVGLVAAVTVPFALCLSAQQPAKSAKVPTHWIWLDAKPQANQTAWFRKEFTLKQRVKSAKLFASCDNQMVVYLNGKEVLASDLWETPVYRDVTDLLQTSVANDVDVRNVIAVKAHNSDGPAGLVLRLTMVSGKQSNVIATDASWLVSPREESGWNQITFNDTTWATAAVVAKLGAAPWTKVTEATFTGGGGGKFSKPTATPIELIKVKKDFKVELLYSVPKATQGSWVNMCVDPKGRLITSDQGGRLYRVTPPAIGGSAEDIKVEMLPVELGGAHGLLWAFDSLYVMVTDGKYPHGLWRVTSSKNDDQLDAKELLRSSAGGGEHGPHAIILGPDKKSLYVCCGNHTPLTKHGDGSVPQLWQEDYLVPRMWDASGHAVNIFAPGGHIYKMDPDGKNWGVVSIGYRNQFDAAFNKEGDLFTYDSDMEWFMNLPFYRPTRIMHAVPGSDFGWRSGSATKPAYFPDNLPATVDVGPGSPCGVTFGYGAKFPAKYQEAFFGCDWSYGKLYAAHFKPQGASYTGELEEFLNGSPLPLTDVVINPKDGAMYFTIGGRNTMSGLYRVTYVGKESTEPVPQTEPAPNPLRDLRRKLESYYKADAQAVAVAWPNLGHEDRHIRWAARTVLEFQDPTTWQDKALNETNPVALTNALIGLIRASDKSSQPRILEALERVDFAKLSVPQKLDYLRAYQLAIARLGAPEETWKQRVGKRIDAWYPAASIEVNAELAKLAAYLEVPGGVGKTLALLAKAPSQEEQIDYAMALRIVKSGWTVPQREEYLNWFHKAANYRGGNSFHGFLRNIRTEAIKTFAADDLTALRAAIDNVPTPTSPKFTFKQRPLVKKYTVEELVPVLEKGLTGRNFDNGRNLFGETKCFVCHRFANEGGGTGPDLTQVVGRFGPRDLLESIIEPSKVISDQYGAVVVTLNDGRSVNGRIVNLAGDGIMINTDMLDHNKITTVNRNNIDTIGPSKISMMPEGLIDGLTHEEILDLVAYLYSRGDRNGKMYRKE